MRNTHAPLTAAQSALVEDNLQIVHWVIVKHIQSNAKVCGLAYEDLYQQGCLYLCSAAQSYQPGKAKFTTYAEAVVRNGLISYCRHISRHQRHVCQPDYNEDGELLTPLAAPAAPDELQRHISDTEVMALLEARKAAYTGTTRKGIEALQLRIQGATVQEIAALYQVPAPHVGAWISRCLQKLRTDREFLAAL